MLENKRTNMKELAKALLKARAEMGKLINNAKNPHFRSNYATLDEVIRVAQEPLASNDVCVIERCVSGEHTTIQQLTMIHCESGEEVTSSMELVCKDPTNPQQLKSAQTYARRMLWTTAAGLAPEDDDGNAATAGGSNTAKDAAARLRQALGSNVGAVERYARSKGILGEGEPLEKLDIKWILKGLSNPEQLIEKANEQ
jgi:hypothetical protein